MRCPQNYQGDRCRKDKGHDSALAMKPDPVHEGQFNKWNEKGQVQVLHPIRFRRSELREADRLLSAAVNPRSTLDSKQKKALLAHVEKMMGVPPKPAPPSRILTAGSAANRP